MDFHFAIMLFLVCSVSLASLFQQLLLLLLRLLRKPLVVFGPIWSVPFRILEPRFLLLLLYFFWSIALFCDQRILLLLSLVIEEFKVPVCPFDLHPFFLIETVLDCILVLNKLLTAQILVARVFPEKT